VSDSLGYRPSARSFSRALVTGAAGFIGSHLSETLLADGVRVIGVDKFSDYYDRGQKEKNLASLGRDRGFDLVEGDLARMPLDDLVSGVDVVFHLAAQPGVRASWGEGFAGYVQENVIGTQRLLEAARPSGRLVVYSSSSSIYGDAETLPTPEHVCPAPVSPYGVTKLAAENLCRLYAREMGVPTVSLRYFTVYGPRQRPDMAFTRFLRAAYQGQELVVYGDGEQSRDFTYVDDAVQANLRAAALAAPGTVYNIGGGARASVNDVLALVRGIHRRPIEVRRLARQDGDARHTGADTGRARADLGFRPTVDLADGLARQYAWISAECGNPPAHPNAAEASLSRGAGLAA
jgi:nucleoside-diphosphate-sugar epimerase